MGTIIIILELYLILIVCITMIKDDKGIHQH